MKILAVHGWGQNAQVWSDVLKYLPLSYGVECAQLGFDGGEISVHVGHYDLVVGHSMGGSWAREKMNISWDRFLYISGFSRFMVGEDFRHGVGARPIDRMISRLAQDPKAVLKDFYRRCDPLGHMPLDLGCSWDVQALTRALMFLKNHDHRFLRPEGRVYALAHEKDPLIPRQMTQDMFDQVMWIGQDPGGHFLPMIFPEECAQVIQDILN